MIEKEIKSVNFGLLSPEMIRKMSAIRITTPDTYDDSGYPIEGGLMDLKLGVIDPGLRCKTCGGKMNTCSGHFGSIELVRPVLHIGHIKMIMALLKATCNKCGRILIPPEKLEEIKKLMLEEEDLEEDKILELLDKSKKATKCPHCGAKQGKIKIVKPTTFYEDDQRLFPSEIRERLERITDTDLKMLGLNPKKARPEWAVLTVLPVPPATTRPSITLESGERSEDDLTHKLVDILRINQRLADNIAAGAPQLIIEDLWDLLQYHLTTYFNNEVSGIPPAKHRSGRPLKTLFQRLKGKEGRFRWNLSGKRVNFSARTVISPDPNISIEEVGVPQVIAEELTVPVTVTKWNKEEIIKIIKNEEYPKANYIIRPDGRRKKVTELNKEEIIEELDEGYIVERQLIDGDITIFNRQPSLHRVSMMGHKVKVMPGKTFRLNDAAAKPYNADFDGDEMNLHVPQTIESQIEAEKLMAVSKNIISVSKGTPEISANQDHITGAHLLTREDAYFDKKITSWLLSAIGENKLPKPVSKNKYAGKDIFSMIIPKNISLKYKSKMGRVVEIKNGQIIKGTMEGQGLKNNIILEIMEKNGEEATKEFIDKSTKLALYALAQRGYTIGLYDYELKEKTLKETAEILTKAEKEVDKLIEKHKQGKLERMPGKTPDETLEDLIMQVLSQARTDAGNAAGESMGIKNPAVLMGKAGVRGSMLNVTQMTACVGQTALRGKRILRGYRKKALPYFKEGDISAKARGFIRDSYVEGLNPIEYYFHSMSGRDGLVDKGINTSRSGYMQRRLVNAMIDLSLKEDLTVRNAAGMIIQFMYGEDGVNPQKTKGQKAIKIEKYLK